MTGRLLELPTSHSKALQFASFTTWHKVCLLMHCYSTGCVISPPHNDYFWAITNESVLRKLKLKCKRLDTLTRKPLQSHRTLRRIPAVKHTDAFIENHEPNPNKPDSVARLLGARLIRETSRFINSLKKQDITINELYAVGTSPFGIRMCRDIGMSPMNLPEGVRSGRVPFKIDLRQNSQSMIVRHLRIV